MAASLALIPVREPSHEPVSAIIEEEWQVSFARFILYPSLPSTCPSLVPRPNNHWYRRSLGTWISSSSPTASVHLRNHRSTSDAAILTVCFHGEIIEEHHVSKLHFTWPQVSCLSGYPPRGSRSVFVSYKNSVDEIQKFALLFSVVSEAEAFINALKEILNCSAETEPLNTDIPSEISLDSMLMSTNEVPTRTCEEESSAMTPAQTSSLQSQFSFSLDYEVEQDSHTEEALPNHNYKDTSTALPPSFASFLTNCFPEVQQVSAQPSSSEVEDLKSQIARYMEDPSFQEMLIKVEKVISEIGDDLML